ncbi:50S ribosomal protein L18 [Candidatus Gottesmanbacteria bacterium RIFCSPHIGHO2_01_FULL_42_12]|uniref:Large ribosomal subunit protein uL18 n=1 Tax=Candidatus Gottesmanbacteria bacterium RIFCSPHIGHO2_01_FULL_42_12 TaxID=1798377 RepID=A0A1F5Z4C0_9BACT|nr:MAG: 50S ribosomal protein L18 [Candidatus Gottesmanbacteria bacterium RIFCSPHIGHO2_01_FULL_42_12]
MPEREQNNMNKVRLVVFRSNKYFYAQAVDDSKGETLASADKVKSAEEAGKIIAEKLLKQKVTNVVFDRNSYRFHGNIKKLAEAARSAGLKF